MRDYLKREYGTSGDSIRRQRAKRAHRGLHNCGEYLRFNHYFTIDEYRLVEACFCKQHFICPLCAIRRASKYVAAYVPKFEFLKAQGYWRFYFVTLTVKDGPVLQERVEHLVRSYNRLRERGRDCARGKCSSVWGVVDGSVAAVEVTKGAGSGEWHPHLHLVVAAVEPLPTVEESPGVWRCRKLEAEWLAITGDSSVVDVRPFSHHQTAEKSFCEMFKYALKLSSLSLEDNWTAAQTLAGRKLVRPSGVFVGVAVPEELTDELPLEDLPYVSLLYQWIPQAGYSVAEVNADHL